MRTTDVGSRSHFKEVTLGLLIKDGQKFEEKEAEERSRTGKGRRGRGKTNTKKGS